MKPHPRPSIRGLALGLGVAIGALVAPPRLAFAQPPAVSEEVEMRVQAAANQLEATLEGALQAAGGQETQRRRALLDYANGLRELGLKNRGEAAERALVDALMVFHMAGASAEVERGLSEGIPRMSSWNTRTAMLEAVLEIPGTAALAEKLVEVLRSDAAKDPARANLYSDLAARARAKSKRELPPPTPDPTPAREESMPEKNAAPANAPKGKASKGSEPAGIEPFPFEGTSLEGRRVRLSDFRGKVVLIDFWATWCGPCIAELPEVQKVYRDLKSKGFEIVGVSLDQDSRTLKNFVRENRMTWPQVCDEKGWKGDIARAWGVDSIPATFLIDRNGRLVAKGMRGAQLRKTVEMFLER